MTIKEAILKSLEDLKKLANSIEITEHILDKKYYEFAGRTPSATVSAQLGEFIRSGDARVKRIKQSNGSYLYYLSKDEQNIGIDGLSTESENHFNEHSKKSNQKNFDERDLHKLLSSYLKNTDIYSKTIFHEQSNIKDSNQIWIHPDMVGIRLLKLHTKTGHNFLKAINRVDTFKLYSYEVKKEINNDSELKKAYFQTVSNSSWANYGYLVAFEFSDSLLEEMSRLNQSFGIGIIELNSNPYQSRVLFPAKYRDLDFKTIDKLCKVNSEFGKFIEYTEKLVTANEKYITGAEKELEEFCDDYFKSDSEIEQYCKQKDIPSGE